jgi:AraC-like DNA-binding protein
MRHEELRPSSSLAGLVHRIWMLWAEPALGHREFQAAMPDGRPELIFNLADPFEAEAPGCVVRQPSRLLVGPTRHAMRIRPTGRVELVGVRFRPGAITELLMVSGRELADRSLGLDLLPRSLDHTLGEQLAAVSGADARRAVVERHLLSWASRARRPDQRLNRAVDLVLHASADFRGDDVARSVGMSYRQLARLFRERVGMGPHLLRRLRRFQSVLRALDGGDDGNLARLAGRAGYVDQAHFTREFRTFAGLTPRAYLVHSRELARHFIDGEAVA